MSIKLYELEAQYEDWVKRIVDSGGVVDDDDLIEFDSINDNVDGKLEAYAIVIKNIRAEREAYGVEYARLKDKIDKLKANEERLKERLHNAFNFFNKERLDTPKASISFIKSTSTVVTNESLVPECFFKIEKNPVLSDIARAIKDGIEIKGAELVDKRSIQIK